jgi:nitrate/TMAO reductase-like tetraheme cytochrome c subunit
MGISLIRFLLSALFLLSLGSIPEKAWGQIAPSEFPPSPKEQTVCIECHTTDMVKPEYRDIPDKWRKSVHYQNNVSCNDCHGGDPKDADLAMKPEKGFAGVPKPKEVPKFCGKCHVGIMQSYLESGHGKALESKGRGPTCSLCHGSHEIQKADINIINEKLCGVCHSYDRAKTMKASLLLTEKKIDEIDSSLKILKAGLIPTGDEEKTLFRTQAEYRTLFHTVDVNLVKERTDEFTKRLSTLDGMIQKGYMELKFRQDFSVFIMLIFIGLGITIFLLSRKSE